MAYQVKTLATQVLGPELDYFNPHGQTRKNTFNNLYSNLHTHESTPTYIMHTQGIFLNLKNNKNAHNPST